MKWLIAVLALAGAQAQDDDKKEGLPLEVAETLEFTVDEVTWMSLDVSPDGTTAAYFRIVQTLIMLHRARTGTGSSLYVSTARRKKTG